MRTGSDVEEHHFVRALFVVTDGQLDRVADIAEFAGFGAAKLHAARDVAAVDVQARDNAASEHYLALNLPSCLRMRLFGE